MVKILNKAGMELADVPGDTLAGAMLANTYLRDANLQNADLSGADLRDTNLQGANLDGAILDKAKLENACLEDVSGVGASFVGATLDAANLDNSSFAKASFSGASLQKINAIETKFNRCDFTTATLSIEDANGTSFRNADFSDPSEVEIYAKHTDLRGATIGEGKPFRVWAEQFDTQTNKFRTSVFPFQFDFFGLDYHLGPIVDDSTNWKVQLQKRPFEFKNILILAIASFVGFAALCFWLSWPLSVAIVNSLVIAIVGSVMHFRVIQETNAEFAANPMEFLSPRGHRIEPGFLSMFSRGQPVADPWGDDEESSD